MANSAASDHGEVSVNLRSVASSAGKAKAHNAERYGDHIDELQVFAVRTEADNRLVALPDGASEISIIARSRVEQGWNIVKAQDGLTINGVGHSSSTSTDEVAEVPIRLRSALKLQTVACYIVPDEALPENVDLLLGLPWQMDVGAKFDPKNARVEIPSLRTAIETMALGNQVKILCHSPLAMLDLCSCIGAHYHTIRDAGYEFRTYHAIEIDTGARAIAKAHSKGRIKHLAPHDVLKIDVQGMATYTDGLFTPECGPWARAGGSKNNPPKGFNEKSPKMRPELFIKCTEILDEQRRRNSDTSLRWGRCIQL